MPQLSNDEYAIVMQSLLHISAYIKPDSEVGKMTREAIQILKQSGKGKTAVPSGGSSMCKEDKIKDLFQTFTLNR